MLLSLLRRGLVWALLFSWPALLSAEHPTAQPVLHAPAQPESPLLEPITRIEPLQLGLIILLMTSLASGLFWLWRVRQSAAPNAEVELGFEIITPGENHRFIPLELTPYTLDYLNDIETKRNLRLSSNLNRVTLTPQQNTFFLEDKNQKNALLINRRRVNRVLLQNEDVLDIGELTLLFRNRLPGNRAAVDEKDTNGGNPLLQPQRCASPRGPLPRSVASLQFLGSKQEYPLVRNVMVIGRSETCDMVLNDPSVQLRHARIFRSGTAYKLHNLCSEGSYLNGRRIEQKELRPGDEIALGRYVFLFRQGKDT
jgi:pSer/pThr/pTyr-binding forkhead associated (FHA) protein